MCSHFNHSIRWLCENLIYIFTCGKITIAMVTLQNAPLENSRYFVDVYILNRTMHDRLEIRTSIPVLKNISRVSAVNEWNIFQHKKINFVSPNGHAISATSLLSYFVVDKILRKNVTEHKGFHFLFRKLLKISASVEAIKQLNVDGFFVQRCAARLIADWLTTLIRIKFVLIKFNV